jgi:HEAT repeat protein
VHDDDVTGRIEAVDVLAQRPADRLAIDALVRATRNDRFWGVRQRAVSTVGLWASDSAHAAVAPMKAVRDALIRATFDPDARVREEAAKALGRLPISGPAALDVVVRLRNVARLDRSMIVRGAALASDILLEKDAALPLARQLMVAETWRNVLRDPAIQALRAIDTPDALKLVQQYAPASQ